MSYAGLLRAQWERENRKPAEWLRSDLRFWMSFYRRSIIAARAARLQGWGTASYWHLVRSAAAARRIVVKLQAEIRSMA